MDDERILESRKKILEHVLGRRLTRRQFLDMLATGAAASILAACAPGSTPIATQAPAASPTSPPAATATAVGPAATSTPQVVPGTGILIDGEQQDIATLDPSDRSDYAIKAANLALYDRFWWQVGWPPILAPQLCVDFGSSDDAKEWTFQLTDKAVFHDGSALTAEAVKYSYDRTLRMAKSMASALLPLMDEDSVEVVDDYSLRIVLNNAFAELPWLLNDIFIMNPKQVMDNEVAGDEGADWLIDHEAGSGPFTVKRWEPGTVYEFEALPDYWRGWPGDGRLDGFVWKIVREPVAKRMQLIAGEIDTASQIAIDDIPLVDANPGTHVVSNVAYMSGYIKMNCQRDPFTDVNFRKFVSYAFDYDGLVALRGGPEFGPLLTGPLPDGVPGHDAGVTPVYRQDLDLAREYLDKTTWKDGGLRDLTFNYSTGGEWVEQIGLVLQENLAGFGINLKLVSALWPDRVAACAHPDTAYDTTCMFVDQGPVATSWFRYQWYSPFWDQPAGGGFQSCSFYKNDEVNALVGQAEVTVDDYERESLVSELQHLVMEDAPDIMLFNYPLFIGMSDRIKGHEPTGYSCVEHYRVWLGEA